ncbi:polysaccharide deacetylase [Aneurinibacillus sp. Ricciae_BoGa-3]|uniref:polysaccharide deacetylase family protein n=1 Tax=Aneurinibacillus sp. Ricciae_BoGa-3 TaxID=3022697 RepID=UPI0023409E45|nr:polysaccharide deacetylase family protein [Aneurinibacillus sp. Ricciae_BoGa-3]WCK53281.1 polysaccharide deacetylase [Aneurinibacillus sp. Ricciae_BoGa-3]
MEFVDRQKKIAYLTFDDGPSENTAKILEILDLYKIKATFFVIGSDGETEKNLYKHIVTRGHGIGLHSYTHDYSTIYSSIDLFIKDLEKLEKTLVESIGFIPNIYRFPGGSVNQGSKRYGGPSLLNQLKREIKNRGYVFFDWNVDSGDTKSYLVDFDQIIQTVLESTINKENAVILMHDAPVKTTTVQALPEIITGLKKQGFQFDILTQDSSPCQFSSTAIPLNY